MSLIDRSASVQHLTEFARPWLDDPVVTEIGVNRPGEIWSLSNSIWSRHDLPDLTLAPLESLAVAVAKYVSKDVSDSRPILSAVLSNGERIQVVKPPACETGTLSLTIRKPSPSIIPLDEYQSSGFFDVHKSASSVDQLPDTSDCHALLVQAVKAGKNVVIAGETNSGKTTLMKALMQEIPTSERIVTVEDVPELFLPNHPNHVHLFHDSHDISASELLRCALRMNPDRIMLAELRGGETFDFLNIAASGHGGSMTSVHAGSTALTFDRMALMALQSEQGRALPYDVIERLLRQVVDVVVHVTNDVQGKGRHVTDVYVKGANQ